MSMAPHGRALFEARIFEAVVREREEVALAVARAPLSHLLVMPDGTVEAVAAPTVRTPVQDAWIEYCATLAHDGPHGDQTDAALRRAYRVAVP